MPVPRVCLSSTSRSVALIARHDARFHQACADWASVAAQGASCFAGPHWFTSADRAGLLGAWNVLTIRAECPLAVLPLRRGLPGCWKVLRWFGLGEMQLAVDSLREAEAWHGLTAWMCESREIALLSLGLTDNIGRLASLADACAAHGLVILATPHPTGTVWSVVPERWEAFLAGIGSSSARLIKRAEKKLAQADDVTFELLSEPNACAAQIPTLARLYRRRWQGQALVDLFASPAMVAWYQQIVHQAAAQGEALVGILRERDRPVLVQTMFFDWATGTMYQHLTARDPDALPSWSPGIIGSAAEFRWAISHGFSRVNQGPVMLPYKATFGGMEHPRWQVTLARATADVLLREPLARAVQAMRHLPDYLRLWVRCRRSH